MSDSKVQAFTFGDPEPVLNKNDFSQYYETWLNGRYYEPPVSLNGLAKSFSATPYLSTAITYKKNQLVSAFRPHRLLSSANFERMVLDNLVFGNGYIQRIDNRLNEPMQFKGLMGKYMRRMKEPNQYLMLTEGYKEHEFSPDSVCCVKTTDINQEIYGVPEYMSALQSAWLNESATLFRRKYYNNGSHAGFILYMTDSQIDDEDVEGIKQAMKDSRGPGNFRNLFLHAPGGKKDGLQLIPISELAAKDEFTNIKSITRDDILASFRTPPQLLGIIPSNAGGFGSISEAREAFWYNEIVPEQARIANTINEWAGEMIIRFKNYGEVNYKGQDDPKPA
ncbi:phage portal protein [Acinetobacter baumannii]|uniref:phage portal protein n=1 Tax=Acinetobacter calcoaceticus/baumannii complex TaxID=909768 RepID=UPI00053BF023|nr:MULTISPECIES: phage portal protein [Acinetobacter calcoaceticus/baumannii complex]EHU1449047.1 phage portal protein [Acinetobacter baumannii]EHU1747740.1 phage portal protein [Acinetobacter baumannii]EHU1800822.1 phage portal protein [Acinetobacter baumannii]EHU1952062.1 phage portal protein [Acinetobacter baumannii]EHZ7969713.1 phage portal protein [Acinetobacter baumannii]